MSGWLSEGSHDGGQEASGKLLAGRVSHQLLFCQRLKPRLYPLIRGKHTSEPGNRGVQPQELAGGTVASRREERLRSNANQMSECQHLAS